MMTVITIAFTMGLIGSLHCVGMCGPLALALPVYHRSGFDRFKGVFLYNLGRITTYALAGIVFGWIGETVSFGGAQRWFSVTMGGLILVFVFLPSKLTGPSKLTSIFNSFFMRLQQQMGKLFSDQRKKTLYVIGLLNGLLPCGMVYLAAVSAVATGTPLKGTVFMAFFGVGTLPAMMGISFLGNFLNQGLRLQFRKAVPVFLFLMSIVLILRGLNLGIPVLSPSQDAGIPCH